MTIVGSFQEKRRLKKTGTCQIGAPFKAQRAQRFENMIRAIF